MNFSMLLFGLMLFPVKYYNYKIGFDVKYMVIGLEMLEF